MPAYECQQSLGPIGTLSAVRVHTMGMIVTYLGQSYLVRTEDELSVLIQSLQSLQRLAVGTDGKAKRIK